MAEYALPPPPAIENPAVRLVAEPWNLDEISTNESGQIVLRGWAFQSLDVALEKQAERCTVNGKPPLVIVYPMPRPDVQEVFWQRRNAEQSGFLVTAERAYPNGVMEVRFSDAMNSRTQCGRESWFLPDPVLHENLPDEDRRFRVIGNRDATGFLTLGCTDAHRLVAAYENVTGKRWQQAGSVLDWGVGCGRVARHLAPSLGDRFFGCDIDADNVAWCNANLPGAYKASRLEPPLPYPDHSFDVIYGVSVFTHLRANWELRWLEELHRVLRPGGVVLMTIHGQTAIDFAGLTPSVYAELMDRVEREGLAFTSENHQLDGFVETPSEYVNVFHSKRHISNVWGKFFRKIEQLPGYIFTHDLIVATKASA